MEYCSAWIFPVTAVPRIPEYKDPEADMFFNIYSSRNGTKNSGFDCCHDKRFWHGESGFASLPSSNCNVLFFKNSAKHLHFRFEQTEKVRIQTGKCYASFYFPYFL